VSVDGHDVTVEKFPDGTVTTDSLQSFSSVAVYTDSYYNSIVVTNDGGGDDFVITGFGTTAITNDPVDFSVPVQIADGDNDVVHSSIDINLVPDTATTHDSTADVSGLGTSGAHYVLSGGEDHFLGSAFDDFVDGNSDDNVLFGGDGEDTLSGGGGNDILVGGDGDDILFGGADDDILVGGLGQDEMHGGAGADTFVLDSLDIDDVIADYSGLGGDGDVIDLSALVNTNGGDVSDYVQYDESMGTLSVDLDGTGGSTSFVDVATLTGNPAAATLTIIFTDGTTEHQVTADTL